MCATIIIIIIIIIIVITAHVRSPSFSIEIAHTQPVILESVHNSVYSHRSSLIMTAPWKVRNVGYQLHISTVTQC